MSRRKVIRLIYCTILLYTGFLSYSHAQCMEDFHISLSNGATVVGSCPGDGVADNITFQTDMQSSPVAYLITDEQNIVLELFWSNSINLDHRPEGTLRIWAFSYGGEILIQSGQIASEVAIGSVCGTLSENYITVYNMPPFGGIVSTVDGLDCIANCENDGLSDLLSFTSTSSTQPYIYIIVDNQHTILGFTDGNEVDFELTGFGYRRVWGLSYTGNLTAQIGENVLSAVFSDGCYSLSYNFVEVYQAEPEGGTVTLIDGSTTSSFCEEAPQSGTLSFSTNGSELFFYAYILTDADGVIIDSILSDSLSASTLTTANTQIWGISYAGSLTANPGENINSAALATGCFDLSNNFISINQELVDGGTVSFSDGSTTAAICVGDGIDNIFELDFISSESANYRFLVTDDQDNLLLVLDGNSINFEVAGVGNCRIYGVSYLGNITISPGMNIFSNSLSDLCSELSSNFIEVSRETMEGGMVSTSDGATTAFTCPANGIADSLTFLNTNSSGPFYSYLITDSMNIILNILEGNQFDFDGAPEGNCRVWGVAYSGALTAVVGEDAAAIPLSEECYDLSSNYIEVIRQQPEGGTILTTDGAEELLVCAADGNEDLVSFEAPNSNGGNYAYLITDNNNQILDISEQANYDFEGLSTGTCRVWGLAYTGTLTANPGDDAAFDVLSDDCFDLSDNYISVVKEIAEGGSIVSTTGVDTFFVCVGDGVLDFIGYSAMGQSAANYLFVITDDNNIILGTTTDTLTNFETAGSGNCRIWGLSYTGNLLATTGMDAGIATLSDDCFDLSDNFLTIFRDFPAAGIPQTTEGQTSLSVCVGDGVANVFSFEMEGSSNSNTAYLITDENNVLQAIATDNSYDFESASSGNCLVFGLAYTGQIQVEIGDTLTANTILTSECFDLSEAFIEVIKTGVDGGMISTLTADTLLAVCVGDGEDDFVEFINTSEANATYSYLITDIDNNVLVVLSGAEINFEVAGVGICRVWGVSYTGNLLVGPGENAANAVLSDECYTLSNNFITVFKDIPDGGAIALNSNESDWICLGAETGVRNIETSSSSLLPYAYVVTDTNNIIFRVSTDPAIDFNDLEAGYVRVWGLSYAGMLSDAIGENASTAILSNSCFELSANFILLQLAFVEGGMITTESGATTIYTCPGDGLADLVAFSNSSSAGTTTNYNYIFTDENNQILVGNLIGNSIDFDFTSPGIGRIWGVSYTGTLNAPQGEDITTLALSDSCFSLSDNFITIVREVPEGGNITTTEGETAITLIVGDSNPDSVSFVASNTSNTPYQYIITDENNVILNFPLNPVFDFETFATGVCRVWGIAYTGNINFIVGEDASMINLSDDCFDLSDNFIEITKVQMLGEDEITGLDIHIHPNPGKVSIQLNYNLADHPEQSTVIQVFNSTGGIIVEEVWAAQSGNNQQNLDISSYVPGLYFVRIQNGAQTETQAFLKQ